MSHAWFERKRCEGGGILFTKFGRAVRYRLSDILQWAEAHRRENTSQTAPVMHSAFHQRAKDAQS
jgi:hypothetical protein